MITPPLSPVSHISIPVSLSEFAEDKTSVQVRHSGTFFTKRKGGATLSQPASPRAADGVLDAANGGRGLQGWKARQAAGEKLFAKLDREYQQLLAKIDAQSAAMIAMLRQATETRGEATQAGPQGEPLQQDAVAMKDVCVQAGIEGRRTPGEGIPSQSFSEDVNVSHSGLLNRTASDSVRGHPGVRGGGDLSLVGPSRPQPRLPDSGEPSHGDDELPVMPAVSPAQTGEPTAAAGAASRPRAGSEEINASSRPAYKILFHWEDLPGGDGKPVSLLAVKDLLESLSGPGRMAKKLKNKLAGTPRFNQEKQLLIDGTPLCIKFGGKGAEMARYEAGIAYRGLLEAYRAYAEQANPDRAGNLEHVKEFLGTVEAGDRFKEKRLLLEKYDEDRIARSLKSYFDNGPTDDMNAYAVGEYDDNDDNTHKFVILKNPSYNNTGQKISGNAVDLRAGNILASRIEAQVNGGDWGRAKNTRVTGGLGGIWEGFKAFWRNDEVARARDGKLLHVISTRPVTAPAANITISSGVGKLGDAVDAAAKTDVIMKDNLSRLSVNQLLYMRDDIEARIEHFKASKDAFINSRYKVVFPGKENDMPTLTHVNLAHWMPAKPPAGLQGADEKAYKEVQQETLSGNINALYEMCNLVNDTLNSKQG